MTLGRPEDLACDAAIRRQRRQTDCMTPICGGILHLMIPAAERNAGVTETDQDEPQSTGTPSPDKPGLRRTHGIRFSDSE